MKNSIEYLDKISKIIEEPNYFKELEYYGITDKEEQRYIFEKIFGCKIIISGRVNDFNVLYREIYRLNKNYYYKYIYRVSFEGLI
jgi:hypothetical protein